MGVINKIAEKKETGSSGDPILTDIVSRDNVSWIRKPNLRKLYFLLVPACIGIEITSGFDSQLINALQIVPSWVDCTVVLDERDMTPTNSDFQISITPRGL